MFYSSSIVILFENSLEKVARLLLFLIHVSKGSRELLGRQYSPFLEAPRPAPSIPTVRQMPLSSHYNIKKRRHLLGELLMWELDVMRKT